MSIVTSRLFVLVAWKYGERSHHCGTVRGWWFISRAPSGRTVDSTWMTSAPNMPERVGEERPGPERREVGDPQALERPGAGAAPPGAGDAGAVGRSTALIAGPTAGAGRTSPTPGIGGCMRNGGAGWRKPPSGLVS